MALHLTKGADYTRQELGNDLTARLVRDGFMFPVRNGDTIVFRYAGDPAKRQPNSQRPILHLNPQQ